MKKGIWLIPLLLLLALLSLSVIQKGSAVNGNPLGYAAIYPESGDIYTNIFLQIRNFSLPTDTAGFPYGQRTYFLLDLFWDGLPVMTGVSDNGSWYYDIYFQAPNEYPYSNIGNHTVYGELWTDGITFRTNFTLTFAIVQYYPPADMFFQWWNNLTASERAQLIGPQGPQGAQGIEGETGPQGVQGVQGSKGEKGDTGVYPLEAVELNIGMSTVAIIVSITAAIMVYKKPIH